MRIREMERRMLKVVRQQPGMLVTVALLLLVALLFLFLLFLTSYLHAGCLQLSL